MITVSSQVLIVSIELCIFHLCADELVQPVEIGKTMIVVGVPVFDSGGKVIMLEVHITSGILASRT